MSESTGHGLRASPHITVLEIENIKKLRAVRITPNGSVVQITGPNGSGKSSVLDAIFWALGGTKGIEAVPIRQGEERAVIKLSLGPVTVIRRFTPSGSTLVVEAESGARYPSPQRLLDDLLGTLTFDPLAFDRMPPKQRLDELQRIAPLPIEIHELDTQNAADFTTRTETNRTLREVETQAMAITVPEGTPAEPVDTAALLAAMEHASEANAQIERAIVARGQLHDAIDTARARAQDLRDQSQALLTQADRLENDAVTQEHALRTMAPVLARLDVALLRAQVESAQQTNHAVLQEQSRHAMLQRALSLRYESDQLTTAMVARASRKAEAIAAAAMPVPGLGYGDGDVFYNGLPYDQASGAERLRVSMAIAMAGNPQLRVLRIKDGSLLDETSLALVAELATQHDFQVWLEKVQEGGKVGIEMHDGSVSSIDGEPVSEVGA